MARIAGVEQSVSHIPAASIAVRMPVTAFIVATALVGAALSAAHFGVHALATAGVITHHGRVAGAFDMDAEVSIPTWYSTVLLALIGVALLAAGRLRDAGRGRLPWYALGAGFLYLSLDEGAALHESLMYATRNALGITGGPLWYAWVIPVGIALALVSPLLLWFALRLTPVTRMLMLVAAVLYVGGALGIEILGAGIGAQVESLERDADDTIVWVLAGVEETLEVAGLVVMLAAVLRHLREEMRGAPFGVVLR
ncbi:hypothetical protein M4I32_11135 [Microbacterium sp. LRZ72]|uniref:hypothetical protein n=1 Tax=Microbacterium sp. LRZ72 TaxID=2942481 RepID=UPI0029BA48DF|nr:hypothetical protein [Microbacterium sp. LRZ72]MDX2377352.1 hypothetical protein [Microbacterium sp. LRZ72]